MGYSIGLAGLALCVILCGIGSAIGLFFTSQAASGVLAEDSKKFSKVFILVVLPATQGIYGFVLALIGQGSLAAGMSISAGWRVFFAAMPMAVAGITSAIFQGKSAVAGIYTVAKNESLSGKLILFPAMIEFYAILGLVISIIFI